MVIELVHFKLNEDATPEAFTQAWHNSMSIVQSFDGFVKRELLHDVEHNEWTDLVHWESLNQARDAAAQFPGIPELAPFAMMINPQSITMTHLEQKAQT